MSVGLTIKNNVLDGNGVVTSLNIDEVKWTRSVRLQGGFWQGKFQLSGPPGALRSIFETWLGYDVSETQGGDITWQGLIYEMDYLSGGVRRRRSLDLMRNYITVIYIDENDTNQETSAASQSQSIARYGRREAVLTLDTYNSTLAENYRDSFLTEYAWPWPRPLSLKLSDFAPMDQLTVVCCGYIFTANWRYNSQADGTTTGNISAYISDIVTNDCEFLSADYGIKTNTVQVKRSVGIPQLAYDVIAELNQLSSASTPWQFFVGANRQAFYREVETTPRYHIRNGQLETVAGGQPNPWRVLPAVVRDVSWPIARAETGSFLADARDISIDEVEVDWQGKINLKTGFFNQEDLGV